MKIAIAGFGVEGQASFAYWSRDPANQLTIVDEKLDAAAAELPAGVPTILGDGAFSQLNGFDMIVRTAGLAPYKIITDGKMWSATNEFFARCPAPIIGVTGSKGKGTTASLIAAMLEAAGKKVWLVGNIGLPGIGLLDDIAAEDIVVYELSSFQLWDVQYSPHVAVVLFIEQEHLDVHRSMEDYVGAKAMITHFQTETDLVVYNAANEFATNIATASKARQQAYPNQATAHIASDTITSDAAAGGAAFYYGDRYLCPVGTLHLKGAHNQLNAIAAIDAVWEYTQDAAVICRGLAAFKGLPHRLAFVQTVNGVEYYDDSIATIPGAAIAALRAFPDTPKVIILGGSYKGSAFSELASELNAHDVQAILIGAEAGHIAQACRAAGFLDYEVLPEATAEQFTRRAAELAVPGSVVLLSPAAASFGQFKNYADRGDQFAAAVRQLAEESRAAAA